MNGGDAAGRLVRPFTLTGGRTRPARGDFTLITMVAAVDPQPAGGTRPQPEHARILRLCARPIVVAELATGLLLLAVIVAALFV